MAGLREGLWGITYGQYDNGQCAEEEVIACGLLSDIDITCFCQVHKHLDRVLRNIYYEPRPVQIGLYETRRQNMMPVNEGA
jgi:hypothetical protein